jgi:hypothetical protein
VGRFKKSASPPFALDWRLRLAKKSQGDLGTIAEERLANKVPLLITHDNNRAAGRVVCLHYVAAVDPKMPTANAIRATLVYCYLVHRLVECHFF